MTRRCNARRSNLVRQAALPCVEGLELRRLFAAPSLVDRGIAPGPQSEFNAAAAAKAPKPPARPDLQAASDNGNKSNDDVTSVQQPFFDIDRADANMTVQLLRDGVVVASVFTSSGGTVTLQDMGPITSGRHDYSSRQVNGAGIASAESQLLSVTFVASATPPAAPSTPDLQSASDTGRSSTDNLTAAATPTFTIAGVQSGLTVRLLRDGVVVASGVAAGNSITLVDASALADGTYAYTAVAFDSASGLNSAASGALSVRIDRSAPASSSAPDLGAPSDSGASDSDNLTSAGSLSFTINGVEAGALVELLRDGAVVASGIASGASMVLADAGVSADGAYSYSARQTDAAGNVAAPAGSLAVTVDRTAPAAVAPDLAAASDTGSSNSDNVTSASSLSFTVAGVESGATVQLLRDGVVVAGGVASSGSIVLTDSGALADGTYSYSALQTDGAGNVAALGGSVAVTVDASAPSASAAPDLNAAYDTGSSDSDDLTSATSLSFTVTGVEAGATVELLRDGVVVAGGIASGSSIVLADAGSLADGVYQYSTRQTDAAGNVGAIGGSLAVTVDATAPATPGAPDLETSLDSGASNSDDLTNVTSPAFSVADVEAGSTLQLLRDGVVVTSALSSAGGTMTIPDLDSLADGTYSYTTRVVDAAGNVSASSAALSVTIDASAPAASAAPDLQAGSDSGPSNTDNVTSVTTPVFDVTGAEAGTVVELLRDGVVVAGGVAAADGTLTLADSNALADGVYSYATRLTDAAGNVGALSAALQVTVDTGAPVALPAPVLSGTSDSGIKGDNVTRDRRPVFAVSGAEVGATVLLLDGGVVVGSAVSTGGTTLVQPTALLAPGVHSISAQQVDAAGNIGPVVNFMSVTIVNALASSDFDGDGISDAAVFNGGTWQILQSSNGTTRIEAFGSGTDVPVPGDYDGDGKADIATYRPGSRLFTIVSSANPENVRLQFISTVNQLPVPADYDGDGKTDVAVYNYSTGVFTIIRSTGGTITRTVGPVAGALPAVGDFDGDGKADPAIFDAATGNWIVSKSTGGTLTQTFGAGGGVNQPNVGDFDGDGYDDFGVYNSSTATFSASLSGGGGTITQTLGATGGFPVAGDFDGDHRTDFASYSRSTATFTIQRSTAGLASILLGTPGGTDQPLPLSPALVRKDVLGI